MEVIGQFTYFKTILADAKQKKIRKEGKSEGRETERKLLWSSQKETTAAGPGGSSGTWTEACEAVGRQPLVTGG